MKAMMVFTGSGPMVILTSASSLTDPPMAGKLRGKGIDKFIAYEIPLDLAKTRYGGHFDVVMGDLRETDDLRILDYNGHRAFHLFRFDELKGPIVYDPTVQDMDQAA